MTDSFKPDECPAPYANNYVDFTAIAKQECEAYLKKREERSAEEYEKIKEALKECGNTFGTLQFSISRDNLIQIMAEYLIERDKPEGEDEI
jgi:hypothetical protein